MASREENLSDETCLTSVTTRIRSIEDKFASLVLIHYIYNMLMSVTNAH